MEEIHTRSRGSDTPRRFSKKRNFLIRWVILGSVVVLLKSLLVSATENEDLYDRLGVSPTASIEEIRKAYRRKALQSHPDKVGSTNISEKEANDNFRRIAEAFEVLSDNDTRRHYDMKRATTGGGSFAHSRHRHTNGSSREGVKLKRDRPEIRYAQERVLHVKNMQQLRNIVTNNDGTIEKNILISFVAMGSMENYVNDQMCFPYPFSGLSKNGVWWDSLVQTVQVSYQSNNDVADFFGIPDGKELRESRYPVFLFIRRGQSFDSVSFSRLDTNSEVELERWVMKQMEVKTIFGNHHSHPIEIYLMRNRVGHLQAILKPKQRREFMSMLGDEYYVRDTRVDTYPDSKGRERLEEITLIGIWKITNDTTPFKINVWNVSCADLATDCPLFKLQGKCDRIPSFMDRWCRSTCGICEKEERERQRSEKLNEWEAYLRQKEEALARKEDRLEQRERELREEIALLEDQRRLLENREMLLRSKEDEDLLDERFWSRYEPADPLLVELGNNSSCTLYKL